MKKQDFKKLQCSASVRVSSTFHKARYLSDDLIACTDISDDISIYDMTRSIKIAKIPSVGHTSRLAFEPNKWLIAGRGNTIKFWNIETLDSIEATTKYLVDIVKSLGNKMIACAEGDGDSFCNIQRCCLSFWLIGDNRLKKVHELEFRNTDETYGITPLPNNKIAISLKGVLKIFDYEKKVYTKELEKWVFQMEYLRDNLIALTTKKKLMIYNFEKGEIVKAIELPDTFVSVLGLNDVFIISFNGEFQIYDMQSFQILSTKKISEPDPGSIYSVEVFQSCGKNRFLFKDDLTDSIHIYDFNKSENGIRIYFF